MDGDPKLSQLALTLCDGVGSATLKSLISYCGSSQEVFKTARGKLKKIPGIGTYALNNIINNKSIFEKAEKILKYTLKEKIKLFFYTDKNYPYNLKQLFDSPSMIYLKGHTFPVNRRYISIVGTRKVTKEGRENLETIIREIAPYNPIIISGLAYGVDIQAHKEALKNQLTTYGVMATGIEQVYPFAHTKIADKMLEKGGLITEYSPNKKLIPAYFPARNRIIAGLSEATLVVESGVKGGALITAYLARSYDREVFAIPGNLKNKMSVGCNNIIKNNIAQLISSAQDIASYLGWNPTSTHLQKEEKEIKHQNMSKDEQGIIELLAKNDLGIDELSWRSQIQIGKLASILLNLEFKNIIISLPGKKYTLK